jgi:hypothetical protein
MNWLNKLILENANRSRINSPIYVAENPIDDTAIGYMPSYRMLRLPIGIQFGWDTMLLAPDSLGFIVAHEFAHVARNDLRWMTDKVCLSPILRFIARTRREFGLLPRSELRTRASHDEYEADRIASEFYPKEAFGRNMIMSLAAITANNELLETGPIGGFVPKWANNMVHFDVRSLQSFTLKETCAVILSTFRANRKAFEICADRGRANDNPIDYHPSVGGRLSSLGLDWETLQASCDFQPEALLDMEEFEKWAPPEFRLVCRP